MAGEGLYFIPMDGDDLIAGVKPTRLPAREWFYEELS